MDDDCIFCGIRDKKIPADIVFEDDQMIAFRDITPQAPEHLLVISKKHIRSFNDLSDDDAVMLGRMFVKIKDIARGLSISESGYRVVVNCNGDAGQEVFHLHVHLLGGRKFTWPPG